MSFATKTYASTFIYSCKDESGTNTEKELLGFLKDSMSTRVNKNSEAMAQIRNIVKERQTSAVLFRVLMNPNVILCYSEKKELPASFKVFAAKDVYGDKKIKTFIDVTGLFKYNNGYFSCKEVDKLCAYLLSAAIIGTYYEDATKICGNTSIVKSTANCYTKLFTGVLDYLRVINYAENKDKISYIVTVFYLFNLMGKDLSSAQSTATALCGLQSKNTNAWNYYYDEDKDFKDINTFITFLAEMFKLKGLNTEIFVYKWIELYGKGTMYGTELLPAFLTVLSNAYSGSYINRQNIIENYCGKEMVNSVNSLLRVAAEVFNKGYTYADGNIRNDIFTTNNR